MSYTFLRFAILLILMTTKPALACIDTVKESRAFFWTNYRVILSCVDGAQQAYIEAENLGLVLGREPMRSVLALRGLRLLNLKVANLQIGSRLELPGVEVQIQADRVVFSVGGSIDVTPITPKDTHDVDAKDAKAPRISITADTLHVQGDESIPRLIANSGAGLGTIGGIVKLLITDLQDVPVGIASVEGARTEGTKGSFKNQFQRAKSRNSGQLLLKWRRVPTG